jgi:hypothetical protein
MMEFLDHLNDLFIKTDYVYWADIYKQLEDAATNGEKYTTFTENFRAVRDLVEAAGLKYENGKHEVKFIKVWGWA